MLLNARTAAARSASFFHHLQASRCGSIRSDLSLLHDANEESSLVCSVSITESSCRVRPSKGFCWQGHRGRIDSRCVGLHNGNVALPEGQMEAQSVSKALSQVEFLMQQGSRMTAVAQVIYPCFMCISSLLFSSLTNMSIHALTADTGLMCAHSPLRRECWLVGRGAFSEATLIWEWDACCPRIMF